MYYELYRSHYESLFVIIRNMTPCFDRFKLKNLCLASEMYKKRQNKMFRSKHTYEHKQQLHEIDYWLLFATSVIEVDCSKSTQYLIRYFVNYFTRKNGISS